MTQIREPQIITAANEESNEKFVAPQNSPGKEEKVVIEICTVEMVLDVDSRAKSSEIDRIKRAVVKHLQAILCDDSRDRRIEYKIRIVQSLQGSLILRLVIMIITDEEFVAYIKKKYPDIEEWIDRKIYGIKSIPIKRFLRKTKEIIVRTVRTYYKEQSDLRTVRI